MSVEARDYQYMGKISQDKRFKRLSLPCTYLLTYREMTEVSRARIPSELQFRQGLTPKEFPASLSAKTKAHIFSVPFFQ